jgi:hypothetical protein
LRREQYEPVAWEGRRVDRGAVIGAFIVGVMTGTYVWQMGRQGDHPVAWFLGGLLVSALLGIYGAAQSAPGRGAALAISGILLIVLGVLGIYSIGLPILVAGALILSAAARTRRRNAG